VDRHDAARSRDLSRRLLSTTVGRSISAADGTPNLLISAPRFSRRAALVGECQHSQHPHPVVKRQGDDAPDPHRFARLRDALAVDAGHALPDDRLRQRTAFYQPDAVEVAIDPQGYRFGAFNPASAAKALPGRGWATGV
jgi:hypothetical protein